MMRSICESRVLIKSDASERIKSRVAVEWCWKLGWERTRRAVLRNSEPSTKAFEGDWESEMTGERGGMVAGERAAWKSGRWPCVISLIDRPPPAHTSSTFSTNSANSLHLRGRTVLLPSDCETQTQECWDCWYRRRCSYWISNLINSSYYPSSHSFYVTGSRQRGN